jgi:hypothetical protein
MDSNKETKAVIMATVLPYFLAFWFLSAFSLQDAHSQLFVFMEYVWKGAGIQKGKKKSKLTVG